MTAPRHQPSDPGDFYRALLSFVSEKLLVLGPDGRIRYANEAYRRTIEWSEDELTNASFLEQVYPDDVDAVRQELKSLAVTPRSSWSGEFRLDIGNEGVLIRARAENRLDDPMISGIVMTMRNVGEQRALEEDLQVSRERYRRLFNEMPVMFVLARPINGVPTVHDCNARFLARLGYRIEDVVGRPLEEFYSRVSADDMNRLTAAGAYDHFTVGQTLVTERGLLTSDGEIVHTLAEAMTEFDSRGKLAGVRIAYLEITERKQLEERLTWQAFHDPLTGLPNRALFLNRLNRARREARTSANHLAILYIDLDHFKPVNDHHGHSAGDQLLELLSRRLESCVRESDTVARLAGDEFAILLDHIDVAERAPRVAERVIAALSSPFQLATGMVTISASIGIAYSHTGRESADELLRFADVALYQAKHAGKSRYMIYTPEMDIPIPSPDQGR